MSRWITVVATGSKRSRERWSTFDTFDRLIADVVEGARPPRPRWPFFGTVLDGWDHTWKSMPRLESKWPLINAGDYAFLTIEPGEELRRCVNAVRPGGRLNAYAIHTCKHLLLTSERFATICNGLVFVAAHSIGEALSDDELSGIE